MRCTVYIFSLESRDLEHGTPAKSKDPGESRNVSLKANMNPRHPSMSLASPRPSMSYHCLGSDRLWHRKLEDGFESYHLASYDFKWAAPWHNRVLLHGNRLSQI